MRNFETASHARRLLRLRRRLFLEAVATPYMSTTEATDHQALRSTRCDSQDSGSTLAMSDSESDD